MWMMRRHQWISTLQDTRDLVQPVTCFSAVMGRGWEDRLVTASGRMEFHVNVSTIIKEANTDICWKRWPIQAARQISLWNIHCLIFARRILELAGLRILRVHNFLHVINTWFLINLHQNMQIDHESGPRTQIFEDMILNHFIVSISFIYMNHTKWKNGNIATNLILT